MAADPGKQPSPWRGATWQSNLVVGLVTSIAGLSGKLTLVGTQSSNALAAVGAGLLLWGLFGWWRQRDPA